MIFWHSINMTGTKCKSTGIHHNWDNFNWHNRNWDNPGIPNWQIKFLIGAHLKNFKIELSTRNIYFWYIWIE